MKLGALSALPMLTLTGCLGGDGGLGGLWGGLPSVVQISETFEPWDEAPFEIGSLPVQRALSGQGVVKIHPMWSMQPVARYALCARVMRAQAYRFDELSKVCPVDLALAWGAADDDRVLAALTVTQSGRWYRWRADELPLPARIISHNTANVHMVPASERLKTALLQVGKGDRIAIEGLLIDLIHDSGRRSNTSRSRTDTGAGACEILYVQRIEWL